MTYSPELIKKLEEKAKIVRRDAITMINAGGMGWVGGSFSQADILTTLLFHIMKIDPKNPKMPDRDRLIVSKAHCCETVYSALGELGFFPKSEYAKYGHYGALLQAHTEASIPGVEYSGGSLGEGLSFSLGQALAARIGAPKDADGRPIARYRVFTILGDGEIDEGQVWEAVMAAAHYKVDNLYAFVDHNKYQSGGKVADRINTMPLAIKFRAFGWDTTEIDGHNYTEIITALDMAKKTPGKPHMIVAHTIKCKGVPSFENKNMHFCTLTEEQVADAMKALA